MINKIVRALPKDHDFEIKSWDEFDQNPFLEARKKFLAEHKNFTDRMLVRVEPLLRIEDFDTVYLLLERLQAHYGRRHLDVTSSIINAIKRAMELKKEETIGPLLDLLFPRLDSRFSYQEEVRDLFEELFKHYYVPSRDLLFSEMGIDLLSKILIRIGHCGDVYFIPILEKLKLGETKVFSFFDEYAASASEMLKLEGLRRLVVEHLKRLRAR